jgi:preprotein translocase subunit SecA
MAIDLITSQITFNGMEEVQKMLNILMEYGNNMPRWILKGHSSDSIFEKIEKPRLKSLPDKPDTTTFSFIKPRTGRNEPCPCGSGKKYKNCCGNN